MPEEWSVLRRRKVHSLIDKVYDPTNLAEAWKNVRENKGSAGIDGLTVAGFSSNDRTNFWRGCTSSCERRPIGRAPVKRVAIPKLGGGTRNLGIPSVRDRVVQQALVQKMTSHLRTAVCGLLVRISTRPIATYGDAEGVAGNPRGQLLDFRRRLARLL